MGMDENAGLYHQKLCYHEATGPYQCLTSPWWVRTIKHGTYPPRHACHLEPLICGQEVFGRIMADILAAKQSVDIITWGFDPGMVLVREGWAENGVRYGALLKEIATRKDSPVTVRLLLWHDNEAAHAQTRNNPGFYGGRIPTIGGYAGYFSEAHDRFNQEWFDEIIGGSVPNIHLHVREVPLSCVVPALEGEKYRIREKGVLGAIYPTHHQKMVLVDYETPDCAVGYVMGHNSTTDFWDTIEHRFNDPLREILYKKNPIEAISRADALLDEIQDSYDRQVRPGVPTDPSRRRDKRVAEFTSKYGATAKPYQDVSLRIRGPILCDLNHNFCYGWAESERAKSLLSSALGWTVPGAVVNAAHTMGKAIDKAMHDVPTLVKRRKHLTPSDFKLRNGEHSAQLLRTYPEHQEKSIKECYANLTRLTQHFIFIQNQYIQYQDWVTHLTYCVAKLRSAGYKKPIYVFMLTSTPESDGMDWATYDIASRLGQSETMTVEHEKTVAQAKRGETTIPITPEDLAKKGIIALMASMWSGTSKQTSTNEYEETYIHAKVAIVDDAAFTIGSANLNVRSMALDSELNVLSQAKDVAFELRRQLFRQCVNDPGPTQFSDMLPTFILWRTKMNKNSEAMANGWPLTSQIATFYVKREPGQPVI